MNDCFYFFNSRIMFKVINFKKDGVEVKINGPLQRHNVKMYLLNKLKADLKRGLVVIHHKCSTF